MVVFSLAFAYLGVNGFWHQWDQCDTIGQTIQTASQIVYGTVSLIVALMLMMKRPVLKALEWIWPPAMAIAAGLAPVVWGGTGIVPGFTSGIVGLFLGLGMIWLVRRGNRK